MATSMRTGAGHVTRCGALANALGDSVTLFADPLDTASLIRYDWAEEIVFEASCDVADQAIAALRQRRIDGLVIDTYAVGNSAVTEASAAGFTAMFRDGYPNGGECITVDPNPGAIGTSVVLAGPAYIPLPTVFLKHRADAIAKMSVSNELVAILIAFGARDSANCTAIALEAMTLLDRKPRVNVVVSPNAAHADSILAMLGNKPWMHIIDDSDDIAALYGKCDLAIGAPGVSQFERACCGLASILVPQNDRQERLANEWAKNGAAVHCAANSRAIAVAFSALDRAPDQVQRIRECGLSLVDGQGASRLADALKRCLRNKT